MNIINIPLCGLTYTVHIYHRSCRKSSVYFLVCPSPSGRDQQFVGDERSLEVSVQSSSGSPASQGGFHLQDCSYVEPGWCY